MTSICSLFSMLAKLASGLQSSGRIWAPRYLICDEAAQMIFTNYLEEG